MALYLISYDIANKDSFEYGPLWDKLKALRATKILYSEWAVIAAPGQACTLYGIFAPLTTVNDRLLVQEIARDVCWDKLLISDAEFNALLQHARGW